MNNTLLLKLASYLIVFGLGFFLCTRCTLGKGGVQGENPRIKTTITHDTLTIYKPREVVKTIYVSNPTLRTVYKDRIISVIQPDSTPTLSVRDYQDTVEVVKNLKINYKAQTTGVLNNITLGFTDTRPEKTQLVTTVVNNDITTKVPVTGLYVGGFSSPNLSAVGVEATVVMPRISLGAGYNFKSTELQPLNKVQVHFGYNLFPTK